MEMLATLMIVALVSTVLSQGMHNLAQAERRMQLRKYQYAQPILGRERVRAILEGLIPSPQDEKPFIGTPKSIEGWSTNVPAFPVSSASWIKLNIQYNEKTKNSEIWMFEGRDQSGEINKKNAIFLYEWPGADGEFKYTGRTQILSARKLTLADTLPNEPKKTSEVWPPALQQSATQIPELIELNIPDAKHLGLAAAPRADETGRPSRRMIEQF
jgi:hypothetical protein